jgi:hypothetical protein
VDDAVAVALEVGSGRCGRLSMSAATRLCWVTGVGGKIHE